MYSTVCICTINCVSLQVVFIDLEYGGPTPAAFDIANHMCEFVGCEGKKFTFGYISTYSYVFHNVPVLVSGSSFSDFILLCSGFSAKMCNLDTEVDNHFFDSLCVTLHT
jgi:Choline/ethanolamine kinase